MIRLIDFSTILKKSIPDGNDILIGPDGKYIPESLSRCYDHYPINKIEYIEMFDGTVGCMVRLGDLLKEYCLMSIVQQIKLGELETTLITNTPIIPIHTTDSTIYWNWLYDENIRSRDVVGISPIINSPQPMIQIFIS